MGKKNNDELGILNNTDLQTKNIMKQPGLAWTDSEVAMTLMYYVWHVAQLQKTPDKKQIILSQRRTRTRFSKPNTKRPQRPPNAIALGEKLGTLQLTPVREQSTGGENRCEKPVKRV